MKARTITSSQVIPTGVRRTWDTYIVDVIPAIIMGKLDRREMRPAAAFGAVDRGLRFIAAAERACGGGFASVRVSLAHAVILVALNHLGTVGDI
jgi:hypothetical protein